MTYYFLPQPSEMATDQPHAAANNGNKIKRLRG